MKHPTVYIRIRSRRGEKPWIPAFAGMTCLSFVMPAEAGIQSFQSFMPRGERPVRWSN